MQKNITNQYIASIFERSVYMRGKEYFLEGRVLEISQKDGVISSVVKGSGNKKYNVYISTNEKGMVSSISCTCPYYSYCKHAAATLLYYSTNFLNSTKEITNPTLEQEKETKEVVFDINKTSEFSSFNFILNRLENSLDDKGIDKSDIKERWKTIFVIKFNERKYYYTDEEDYLKLSLGLAYVKKDGSYGRISEFKKDKMTESVTGEIEKKLFAALIAKKNFSQPLDAYFDLLLENRDIIFYVKGDGEVERGEFIHIEKILIDFSLKQIDYGNKTVNFKLNLSLIDERGGCVNLSYGYKFTTVLDYLVVLTNYGKILYLKSDLIHLELLTRLLETSSFYKEDIDAIKDFVDKHPRNDIVWEFNKDKIKTVSLRPKPIIEIFRSDEKSQTCINLLFNYINREIESGNSQVDILIVNGSDFQSEKELLVAKRDYFFERKVNDFLKTKFHNIISNKREDYYRSPFDFNLKIGVREFLINHGINLMEEGYDIRFRNQKAKLGKGKGKVNVKVTSGIDWFDINANYITEDGEIKNFNITKDVIKDGLVQIGDNYIILSKEDIVKLSELLKEGMDHNGKLKISKLNFGVIDSLYESISNNDLDELKFAKEISGKLKKFKEIEKNDLPQKFNGKLREYQEAGYNWLHFLHKYNLNGCLADDMGLGKTVQTLAFLQKLKEKGSFGLSLLVVPVTTVANWESEINRFAPEIKFLRHLGQERAKDKGVFKNYDLVISSYHTLRNDIEFFNDFEFDYLILDEAQNIKNHASLIFKTVRIIKAKRKLSLTGTPIENNTTELWSQFNFLNPSLLGSINEFKHKFVNPIEVYKDSEAADRLRKTIYPFILRRKKEEVAKDLPEKEEIIIFCEMGKEQKKCYEKLREYYKSQIGDTLEEKGVEKSAIQIFEALLRLRQAALFPSLVSEEYKNIESVKFETLKDLMEEIVEEKHKALLFSQFVQSLKIIEKEVKEKKIKYSYIDGQTKKRDVEIKRFQEDENTKLFLLSLKAGGVGINLTAADYVILFDPWWNPAAESQAVDRSHRIGQTRKVMVYKLIVKDTVEEKILELQNKKKELVSQLITEEASFFKSLSKNDIMNLFD